MIKLSKFLLLLTLTISFLAANAAKVDTIQTYSKAMNKNIKAVVILPDNYNQLDSLPVIYMLHGYGGNYAYWVNKAPHIKNLVDYYNVMVVCVDGGKGSWYWDSPVVANYKYETYVTKELIPLIDQQYKSSKSRLGRGIMGLSMGGHGALYLSIRHQSLFGVAGSMAGGVDIRPFPEKWEMAKYIGKKSDFPERWDAFTVTNLLESLKPNAIALSIDCGKDDFFYDVNEELHKKLITLNIPHSYTVNPGKHNLQYWGESVKHQFLFFNSFFQKATN